MEILNKENESSWENFTRMQKNLPPQHSLEWKKVLKNHIKIVFQDIF